MTRTPTTLFQIIVASLAIAGPSSLASASFAMTPFGGDPLAAWLASVSCNLPSEAFETPLGVLDLDGGTCGGLNVAGLQVNDLGPAVKPLQLAYHLKGLGFSCRITAQQQTLTVDVGVAVNTMALQLAFHEADGLAGMEGPALPLGNVEVLQCEMDVQLKKLEFAGTSEWVETLEDDREVIEKTVRAAVRTKACAMLTPIIQDVGSQVTGMMAELLAPLEGGGTATPAPASPARLLQTPPRDVLAMPVGQIPPALDWATYPPLVLGAELVRRRSSAVGAAASYVPPLKMAVGKQLAFGNTSAGMLISSVELGGINTLVAPTVALNGSADTIGVSAALQNLKLGADSVVQVNATTTPTYSWGALALPMSFSVELRDMNVALIAKASMSEECIGKLKVDQMQSLGCLVGCSAGLTSSDFGLPSLDVLAVPKVKALGGAPGLAEHLAGAFDVTAAAFLRGHDIASQALVHSGAGLALPKINAAMQQFIGSQVWSCEPSGVFFGPGDATTNAMIAGAIVSLVIGLVVALWSVFHHDEDGLKDNVEQADTFPGGGNIMHHPAVPKWLGPLFPWIAIATAFVFLYSAVSVGTVVNLKFTAYAREAEIDDTFTFSLATSVRDSWNGGAYAISLATLLLSGLWPFVKLALMVLCWVAPRRRLGYRRRDTILHFLDEYGKYSLIDTFLAIFAFAAYRMEWDGPNSSLLVAPTAMNPFFCFILATIMSLILGHVAAEYHRRVVEWDQAASDAGVEVAAPMEFRASLCIRTQKPGLAWAVSIALTVTLVVLIVAAFIVSFTIRSYGVAAQLIADSDDLEHHYSLITFGLDVAKDSVNATPRLMQAVFFGFAFVAPLLLILALLLLWVLPLTPTEHHVGIIACKVLQCWQSIDVFILAVIIGRFEIGKFAEFLVYNDNVKIAADWVRDNMKTECFAVACEITSGFWLLLLAGVLTIVVQRVALAQCRVAANMVSGHSSREIWSEHQERSDTKELERSEESSDDENCASFFVSSFWGSTQPAAVAREVASPSASRSSRQAEVASRSRSALEVWQEDGGYASLRTKDYIPPSFANSSSTTSGVKDMATSVATSSLGNHSRGASLDGRSGRSASPDSRRVQADSRDQGVMAVRLEDRGRGRLPADSLAQPLQQPLQQQQQEQQQQQQLHQQQQQHQQKQQPVQQHAVMRQSPATAKAEAVVSAPERLESGRSSQASFAHGRFRSPSPGVVVSSTSSARGTSPSLAANVVRSLSPGVRVATASQSSMGNPTRVFVAT